MILDLQPQDGLQDMIAGGPQGPVENGTSSLAIYATPITTSRRVSGG